MQTSAGTRRTARSARARSVLPTAGRLCVRSLVNSRCGGTINRTPARKELLFAAFGFRLRPDGHGQCKQIDETFGVLGVVAAHGETRQIGAIERERRNTLGYVERALPQFEADGAGDALLRDVEKSVERFPQRCEPQTVVNQFGVAQRKCLLKMSGFAIDGEPLQFLMRFDEKGSAGSFVSAAGFHPDEAIFDEVGAADAVLRGNFIQRI